MTPDAGRTLSHYRLLEKIGEGGMGVVWKAEDTVLNRLVAIKVLPPEASRDERRRQMFLDEAKMASSLSDAHVVQVYELAREGDLDLIVMELVDGRPLSKLLQGRRLPVERVAGLGLQVARALGKAHKRGLLHRDLKPANILVTGDGDVKVVDFGLAVLFDALATKSGSSSATARSATPVGGGEPTSRQETASVRGEPAGTLPYMAPEQVRGEKLDTRSDVFSLGVVLYEMTTGQRPFTGAAARDLAEEIVRCRPKAVHELVPSVPLELDRIIHKALAARPAERYQTMEDLAVDLKQLGKELESGSAPSYERLVPEVRWSRRKLLAVAGAAALAAVLMGLAAWRGGWIAVPRALDERTILILPFEVRGQEPEAEGVGRSFAEALVIELARAEGIAVLPVPDPGLYPSHDRPKPAEIAHDEGARRVVTGVLLREGDAVQASVSLIDSSTNRVVWGTVEREPNGDLPLLAAVLVRGINEELGFAQPRLYGAPEEMVWEGRTASHASAAAFVGANAWDDYEGALASAEALLASYPQEIAAHAALLSALSAIWYYDPSDANEQKVERALAALDRMDPQSPYAPYWRAFQVRDTDPRRAIEALTRLLARQDLSPRLRSQILGQRGSARSTLGDHDAAIEDTQQAVGLHPVSGAAYHRLSRALGLAGRHEESEVAARRAVALAPGYSSAWHQLGMALAGQGELQEGFSAYQKACELARSQGVCSSLAIGLLRSGRLDEARDWAVRTASMTDSLTGTYNLACFHALAGDRDQAIRWLRRALDVGFADSLIATDSDLESLRGDPEFESIVAEVGRRLASD